MATLLLCTFNDPEARLLRYVKRLAMPNDPLAQAWSRVRANYAGALAVWGRSSYRPSVEALGQVGWDLTPGIQAVDRGLWAVVQHGLDRAVDRIHYCDLDRLLHWLGAYPDELAALPAVWAQNDVTMLVRSPRALQSHPACQVLTEGVANDVLAARLGIASPDAFSGSFVWSRRAAEAIVASDCPRDLRWYSEAVMAPFRAGCSIGVHVVEGLEWETPDQFPDEIAQLGFTTWLANFESAAQWRSRAEMARLFVAAALA